MKHSRPATCAGVTLIQSLIAMAVMAVLTGMALPAIKQTRERLQADSLRMQLASALATARNTAITERRPIAVCPTDDGVTCGRNWSRGWVLYAPATPSSAEAPSAGHLLVQQHARSRLSAGGESVQAPHPIPAGWAAEWQQSVSHLLPGRRLPREGGGQPCRPDTQRAAAWSRGLLRHALPAARKHKKQKPRLLAAFADLAPEVGLEPTTP
ncbi:GspH/FimT family pseudopilin [Stenotrophomonas rhizophila]|uniref:GspH/FimT family pseudopilin n=1 Tax=Stenotrophomonas rhizophila TaxID=216778 RepID=UPI000EAEB93A|nr:GspH/FimT family pseudopilin [Stenotrophomonas rhizophila]